MHVQLQLGKIIRVNYARSLSNAKVLAILAIAESVVTISQVIYNIATVFIHILRMKMTRVLCSIFVE